MMDFSSFDLQEDEGNLFKQNFQLNNNSTDTHQIQDNTDFFNFIGENSSNSLQPHLHPHGSFSVPQLSPDTQEGNFTNSSVISGHNNHPEFNMSPLQIASHNIPQPFHTPMQHPAQNNNHPLEDFQDEEEFFTPLVSPAMAPTYHYQSLNNNNNNGMNSNPEHIFSPLSSPALNPSPSIGEQSTLQQKLAFIERQQQQLRNMHNQLKPQVSKASPILKSANGYTSPLVNFAYDNNTNNNTTKMNTKKALQQKIAMSSPQFNGTPRSYAIPKSSIESPLALKPHTQHTSFVNKSPTKLNNNNDSTTHHGFIAPATPSLLMKLGAGSGANNNNNSNATSSTSSVPTLSSSSAAVDNMPVLPAAMLQDMTTTTTTTSYKSKAESKRRRLSCQQSAVFSSPGLSPSDNINNNNLISPAGPRPQQSPRALQPLISPSLHPNGKRLSTIEEETARALLTTKSNYENLKEGKAKSLGIDFNTTIQSGIENRRSAHKAAEQKRRDTLKQSFDSLRTEIIEAMLEEEADIDTMQVDDDLRNTKEKDVKQMSKVVLLQHSYEYIVRLKSDNKRKDEKQNQMRQELMALRKQLGLPQVTEEERELEEKEKQDEEDRKKARLQRLETAAAAAVDEGSS